MHLENMFGLSGKVALVTGGGRGIGKFIAQGLAEAGADVVVSSRKIENCEQTARELEALGNQAAAVKADVANPEDVESLVNRVVEQFGAIDILVNNAGMTWGAPTLEFPIEKWEAVFDVNVKAVFMLSQKVARVMKEKGGGKIINISSVYGFRGSPEELHPAVAYNSSKAAINVLTQNLAVKLARYNIKVNAIAPGFFQTDMMKWVFKPEMKPVLDNLLGYIPLAAVGQMEDMKGVAVFLASKASDYMTGAIVPVDGGLLSK